ncbi:hypothetical protein MMC30_000875 [Trapelia coarctata]|nr:hypothetical protein [Trapelia coarctata]
MVGLSLDEAQKQGVVIGPKDVTGIRPRLDIDTLMITKPDTFNLFLLAVADLHSDSGKMGWFEVAGIHGYPTRNWDGVEGRSETEDPYGYCKHGSVLFPFWHRPYMAMIEQTIYHAMVKKAEQFSDQKRWDAAAQHSRLPYWDWLRPRAKQVGHTVIGIEKNGKPKSPFDYIFDLPCILKKKQVMVFKDSTNKISDEQWKTRNQWMSREKTIRRPTMDRQQSDMLHMDNILNKQRESNVIFLLDLFVRQTYSDYLRMSNHSAIKGGGSGSIESLHDNYHDYFGAFKDGKVDWWTSTDSINTKAFGYTYPDLDPVGVEAVLNEFGRKYVWSIHEEARPDGFDDTPPEDMEPIIVNDSPFFKYEVSKKPAFPGGFELTSRMKAEPIEESRPTSSSAQSTPERTIPMDKERIRAEAGASAPPNEGNTEPPAAPEQFEPPPKVTDAKVEQPEGTKAVRNWYVDSLVPKKAFNGCFTLFYFVTGADNIRKPYTQESSLAALNHIFSAPVEACANCAQQAVAGEIISDTEPITPILLDIVKNTSFLESIEPEHIVPFLLKNFQVRVLGPNSENVEPHNVAGLKLSISTTVQSCRPGNLMATDGPKNRFPEITDPILSPPTAAAWGTT